mmetsp:Transcript_21034/g.27199  ORF Transcript_21034/g.27199 Transcript_21034/m.27199 type:complete len:543 (-) Transcript_21034:234-1862(-)
MNFRSERDENSQSGYYLIFSLLFFRIINALVVKTYFTPDEFWQSLEVAYQVIFGKGELTWEWKEKAQIRGYSHPLLFAALYKALSITGCDTVWMVANAPKILQGLFAAVCDLATYSLAHKYFGGRVARWSLFCQLVSWFCFYCLCRTYSNSLEATLTMVALNFWTPIWEGGAGTKNQERQALVFAASCVAIRSTSATLWIFVGLLRLTHFSNFQDLIKYLLLDVCLLAGGTIGLSVAIDSYFYGSFTFTPWNFVKFNVIEGGSAAFGSHPWHWFVSQGLPVICGPFVPLTLMGSWWAGKRASGLAAVAAWFVVIHSLSAHKEFRFLLPILPICNIYAGYAAAKLTASDNHKKNEQGKGYQNTFSIGRLFVATSVLLNIAAGFYFSNYHQRGPLLAVEALASEISKEKEEKNSLQISFWMPCHSTPLYSHLHFPDASLNITAIDCTPRINEPSYISEHQQFLDDTVAYTQENFCLKNGGSLPDFVVMYDSTYEKLEGFFLSKLSYEKVVNVFHTHFNGDLDDPEVRKEIFILKKSDRMQACSK